MKVTTNPSIGILFIHSPQKRQNFHQKFYYCFTKERKETYSNTNAQTTLTFPTMCTNGSSKSSSNGGLVERKQNGKQQNNVNGTTSAVADSRATSKRQRGRGRKAVECLLGLSLPLLSTVKVQSNEPSCRVSWLIASTTAIYGILYAFLRHFNGFLQPSLITWVVTNPRKNETITNKQRAAASEWRSRLLAIFNALILIVGSALCFTEWVSTYVPESEGWVKTLPLECNNPDGCSCFVSYPVTYASLFVGYLQWDLCWLIWHRDTHPDVGAMIHHSIFIGVTQFVLSETFFRKPFAWLSLTELSTPFLHIRWILAATGNKTSSLYFWTSLGFALTFLSTRSIGYGLGLVDVWLNQASWGVISGLWWVVGGLHLAYLLNLFWSFKVGSALVRTIASSSKKGTNAQKQK